MGRNLFNGSRVSLGVSKKLKPFMCFDYVTIYAMSFVPRTMFGLPEWMTGIIWEGIYSTVTLFAKLRGWSTLHPRITAKW